MSDLMNQQFFSRFVLLISHFYVVLASFPTLEKVNWGPLKAHKHDSSNFYALTSPRMYLVGKSRGSYENVGEKKFEYSGLWNLPVKLLKGFYIEVYERESFPSDHDEFKQLNQQAGLIYPKGFPTFEYKFHLSLIHI